MSGVGIIHYVLANNAALTAVIPAARIMGGALPLNTVLPAISVMEVSAMGPQPLTRDSGTVMITERVQCTVACKDYPTQKSIIKLIRGALQVKRSVINSIQVENVVDDQIGPDFYDPDDLIYYQSCDFIARWQE